MTYANFSAPNKPSSIDVWKKNFQVFLKFIVNLVNMNAAEMNQTYLIQIKKCAHFSKIANLVFVVLYSHVYYKVVNLQFAQLSHELLTQVVRINFYNNESCK